MSKDFKISVITPVYNAENFLEQTLDCIAGQTLGFEDNIQSILINDGSKDSSGDICKAFAQKHPDNVVYIEKENGGVSSARNEGIKHIEGKYTVFLDGDDIWDADAFEKIFDFFEKGNESFDVCSCRMKYLGDFTGEIHPLDYKFEKGNRVADLKAEPKMICSTIGNTVFRSSAIKGENFNTRLASGEDSEFVNTILLKKPVLGILSDTAFYYRRNASPTSGSSSAPKRKSWYLNVPKEYYLGLEKKSIEAHGKVMPFIQYVILYDMRWRFYAEDVVTVLDAEEKAAYMDLIKETMKNMDTEVIISADGLNQFKKLYLSDLKYGKDVIKESVRKEFRYYYEGHQMLSLRARTMLFIKALDINDGMMFMEGLIATNTTKRPNTFFILDEEGHRYDPVVEPSEYADLKGLIGENIVDGEIFTVTIPVRVGRVLSFMLNLEGEDMEFRPTFEDYIGIDRGRRHNYCVKSGYIIKLRKNKLSFYADSKRTRLMSEARLDAELTARRESGWPSKRLAAAKMTHAINDGRIRDRIAFVSVRSEGEPADNLARVWEQTDAPKVTYCSKTIQKDPAKALEAAKTIFSSKVVVTDDYLSIWRDTKKREGQYYVQIWHAAGAFKKFGVEGTGMYPGMDAMYHKDYDLVTVSSEDIREIYAKAFRISKDNVRALGVPRSDKFFDEDYLEKTRKAVFEKMPELEGKQIIVYAPSFRGKGIKRVYLPLVDYGRIDKALNDDQIMLLCPHPLMPPYEGKWNYDKIKLVRDISTNDAMIAADLLITDYSSVIFEYSLLNKPMAFFCYDYDEYDRDFYLDYDKDLPGEIFKTTDGFIEYLSKGSFETDGRLTAFREKYMSACDGNSSRRVAEAITEYLNK